MADPVKKDDALALAMREAFQRHMQNAASAARATPRPPRPDVPAPVQRERTPALLLRGSLGPENPPEVAPKPPVRQAPSAPPPSNDAGSAPTLTLDVLDRPSAPPVAADPGAALALRARDAILTVEPHRSAPRLRHPAPANDPQGDVALLERPIEVEPRPATVLPPPALPAPVALPAADERVAADALIIPQQTARHRRGLLKTLLAGIAGAALVASLVGAAGFWLLREPPSLSQVISVVRGMWATRPVEVPLQPVSTAPTTETPPAAAPRASAPAAKDPSRVEPETIVGSPPADTTSELLAPRKTDMLGPRRVHTEPVKLEPIAVAVQDAQDRLASGDLASARLILEQFRGSGDPRALFALAETFDPTEQHNPEAQDRAQAEALYEQAARGGSEQSAERLARLRLGTPK